MTADVLTRMRVIQGDITTLAVDAIVNAANTHLRGGGGVDGAIHRAAGPQLLEECLRIGGCPTGEARLTRGHRLPANFVIHTVGPVYQDGTHGEPELLAACYRASLELATAHDIQSIAFPCISTGVYGYPANEAARIAVATVVSWLRRHDTPRGVVFCCFSAVDRELVCRQLEERAGVAP